jgi:hypothetical protein
LLSIPQITRDNDVFTKFHHFSFFIKDRDMRDVLHRGRLRHSLYVLDAPPALPVSHAPQAFSGVRVSSTYWHARLGHPAAPIVRHVLQRHELPVVSNKFAKTICDACQQGKSHQLPFFESSRVVKHPLEIVFSDVWVLPKRPLVATIIMSALLILIVGLLGFILLSINLMCSMSFFNFKHMSSVS